jgi:transcriptional regulator CtsR
LTESRRGGGGFITISRTRGSDDEWLQEVLNNTLKNDIDMRVATYLIDELCERGIFELNEGEILRSVVHTQALNNPFKMEGKIRAQILRKVLIDKLEKGGE